MVAYLVSLQAHSNQYFHYKTFCQLDVFFKAILGFKSKILPKKHNIIVFSLFHTTDNVLSFIWKKMARRNTVQNPVWRLKHDFYKKIQNK